MADWALANETTTCQHTLVFDITNAEPITVRSLKLRPTKFVYHITYGDIRWSLVGKRIIRSGTETSTHTFRQWDMWNSTPDWLIELIAAARKHARDNGWIAEGS